MLLFAGLCRTKPDQVIISQGAAELSRVWGACHQDATIIDYRSMRCDGTVCGMLVAEEGILRQWVIIMQCTRSLPYSCHDGFTNIWTHFWEDCCRCSFGNLNAYLKVGWEGIAKRYLPRKISRNCKLDGASVNLHWWLLTSIKKQLPIGLWKKIRYQSTEDPN